MSKTDFSFEFAFQKAPFKDLTPYVASFSGQGAINQLFSFNLTLLMASEIVDKLDPESLLGVPATLTVTDNKRLEKAPEPHNNLPRSFKTQWAGRINQVEIGDTVRDQTLVEIELTSILKPLKALIQNRAHLQSNVIDIVEESFKLGGVTSESLDFSRIDRSSYPIRDFVFQYDEDLYAFTFRNLEREGIALFQDFSRGEEIIALADKPLSFPQIKAENNETLVLTRVMVTGLTPDPDLYLVHNFRAKSLIPPKSLRLKDYNWRKPLMPLDIPLDISPNGQGEVYLFGENFETESEGQRLANIRKEEILASSTVYSGVTHIPGLIPGHVFDLKDARASGFDGSYLVTSFAAQGRSSGAPANLVDPNSRNDAPFYRHSFTAQRADKPYRPPRLTPARKISGSLTAWIDGAGSGEKPEMDLSGRYKVLLPLDVSGRKPGGASAWIRQAQPSVGAGYGQSFPLYPGVEVILTFIDGNPDRPIISGAVTNGETGPNINAAISEAAGLTTRGGGAVMFLNKPDCQTLAITPGVRGAGIYFTAGVPEEAETESAPPDTPAASPGPVVTDPLSTSPFDEEDEDAVSPTTAPPRTVPVGVKSAPKSEPSPPPATSPSDETKTPDLSPTDKEQSEDISDLAGKVAALKNTASTAVFNADTIEQNATFNKMISVYDGTAIAGNKFEIKASNAELTGATQIMKMVSGAGAKIQTAAKSIMKSAKVYDDTQCDSGEPSDLVLKSLDTGLACADDILKAFKLYDKVDKMKQKAAKVKSLTYDPLLELTVNSKGESSGVWQSSDDFKNARIFALLMNVIAFGGTLASAGTGIADAVAERQKKSSDPSLRDSKVAAKSVKAIGDLESAVSSVFTWLTMYQALDKKEKKGLVINNEASFINVKSQEHTCLSATGPILLESLGAGRQVDLAAAPPELFSQLDEKLLKPEIFSAAYMKSQYDSYKNNKAIILRTIFQRTLATEINQQAHGALFNKAGRLIQLTTGESTSLKFKTGRREAFRNKYLTAVTTIANHKNLLKLPEVPNKEGLVKDIFKAHADTQDPCLLEYSKDFQKGILLETREDEQHIQLRTNDPSGSLSLWQNSGGAKFSAHKPLESRGLTLDKTGVYLTAAKERILSFLAKEVLLAHSKDVSLKLEDKKATLNVSAADQVALSTSEIALKHSKNIKLTATNALEFKGANGNLTISGQLKINGAIINLG
ncbi:MAG: type VI secretion system tip protein VgrG [Deltaproteobacteria bacterium]|jgi:type VI secretion system VgrG family protein|nr:type VI secretion system tip protein VgrG [Deltaproteobacteria bacterium]